MTVAERSTGFMLALALAAGVASDAAAARVIVSGEVIAEDAQPIFTPPSNSSPVVLRYYVPDGTAVKKGDVVLRIDPGESAARIGVLTAQIDQTRAKAAKEVAELRVKAVDAERARVDADAAHAKAAVDAAIPRQHVSGLDYDRFQGELARSTRELTLRAQEQRAAEEAVERRRRDGELEVGKLDAELAYHRTQVQFAEVRAQVDGFLVHGFDTWRGQRFDEGTSSFPGQKVGEIVGAGPLAVRAWLLQPDRASLREEQAVRVTFDALRGVALPARIRRIAGAPEARAEWGDGRYYLVEITLSDHAGLPLLPGMSARIELDATGPDAGQGGGP